jgi:protein-tyrosine-phosphatase
MKHRTLLLFRHYAQDTVQDTVQGALAVFCLILPILFLCVLPSVLDAQDARSHYQKPSTLHSNTMFPEIRAYLQSVEREFDSIPTARKERLRQLATFIREQKKANQPAECIFICTHNSRRSHTAQAWAQALALYYGIPQMRAFSAGTEVTAFNERAVQALREAGFRIEIIDSTNGSANGNANMMTGSATPSLRPPANPVYAVRYAEGVPPTRAFSKLLDAAGNPQHGFCAVMNCSEAEKNCPVVFGAAHRVSLPYDDPKHFDGTPQEAEQYRARCRQIARELAFAFAQAR